VRMHRNGAVGRGDESYFRGFCEKRGISVCEKMREESRNSWKEDHMTRGDQV
jgi:hypothetical protein